MSKYDAELIQIKQSITGQQEKIKKLESLAQKVQRTDEVIGTLPIRQLNLSHDVWQDKSADIMRQIIQQRLQYWNNQQGATEELLQEIRAEIHRVSNQISDYQEDVRYYANLKCLEENVHV
ncbi:TPA: hypothetical protein ACGY2Z_001592 [Listeria monocytogenes]